MYLRNNLHKTDFGHYFNTHYIPHRFYSARNGIQVQIDLYTIYWYIEVVIGERQCTCCSVFSYWLKCPYFSIDSNFCRSINSKRNESFICDIEVLCCFFRHFLLLFWICCLISFVINIFVFMLIIFPEADRCCSRL